MSKRPARDAKARRAAQRLAEVQRAAIERLSETLDRASRALEHAADACVALSTDSSVAELRATATALHAFSLELSGALDVLVGESARLETVAEVREAMANP